MCHTILAIRLIEAWEQSASAVGNEQRVKIVFTSVQGELSGRKLDVEMDVSSQKVTARNDDMLILKLVVQFLFADSNGVDSAYVLFENWFD